jgi:hypothetical protein
MSHRPTPALVISIVALFVAMGGTGYAASQIPRASVGAAQLKKNAVSSPKVKNGSLALNDFKAAERTKLRGSAGARGAAGARGSQGSGGIRGLSGLKGDEGADGSDGSDGGEGIQGIPGPTGVEQVVVRTGGLSYTASVGPNGQVLSDDVQCQPGESVVGGGADVGPAFAFNDQPNVVITGSRPADGSGSALGTGDKPTGWFVQARRNSNTTTQTVGLYVLCASAGA